MSDSAVRLLIELIAQPSVNPRLAGADDPPGGEAAITRWLERRFDDAGWRWARQQAEPGRFNVVALAPGRAPQTLLWDVHQDTVSLSGMTVAPLAAELRHNRLYGRGACDVKGSMAAMLAALQSVEAEPADGRPSILFCATVNEEAGFTGSRALASVWNSPSASVSDSVLVAAPPALRWDAAGGLSLEEAASLRPVAAIVAEPTELDVVIAHRGVVRWQCVVHGRAAHSSRPEEGVNAIEGATGVVRALVDYRRHILAAAHADPWCGPPTLSVTTIRGGTGANTIPDRVTLDIDRRLTPQEAPAEALAAAQEFVAAQADVGACRVEHLAPWMASRGLAPPPDSTWGERLAHTVRSGGGRGKLRGVPFGTNAAAYAATGIPTAVLGPGSIDQAHTVDEWIAVEQLSTAVEIYRRLALGAAMS